MITPEIVFFSFVAASVVIIPIMWRTHLLSIPNEKMGMGPAIMTPLIGFLLFMGCGAYVPQWIAQVMHYMDTHGLSSFSQVEITAIPQIITLIAAAVLLMGFVKIHSPEVKGLIWGQKGIKPAFTFFWKGVFYCLITYPLVMTLVQSTHMAVEALGYKVIEEQLAFSQLRALRSHPGLFWIMITTIVTIVPLLEELLFRGLLQNFFQGLVGARFAIALASFLFAFFHYALEQGFANIELMAGLFLYAYFMGIFYCKSGSLWVPIGMHAAFNGISIFLMLML